MTSHKLLIAFIFITCSSLGQTVSIMDFIKIKDNKTKEALFFYENNWKVYREEAIKRNFIVSYKIVKTSADSIANFDLILITEYADASQYALSETHFQEIIKEIRSDGPKLLNELKPNDFRKNVFVKTAETIISSGSKKN